MYIYASMYAYTYTYIAIHYMCMFIVVVITRQPENTTACRGSRVIVSCGHNSTTIFDIIWSINGSDFSSIAENDPLYRASNQTLIIFSINYTTTFQCAVNIRQSSIVRHSTTGTVTVVGMYKCIYVCTYVHMCVFITLYMSLSMIVLNSKLT